MYCFYSSTIDAFYHVVRPTDVLTSVSVCTNIVNAFVSAFVSDVYSTTVGPEEFIFACYVAPLFALL